MSYLPAFGSPGWEAEQPNAEQTIHHMKACIYCYRTDVPMHEVSREDMSMLSEPPGTTAVVQYACEVCDPK